MQSVSIVIPLYNKEKYIQYTINSVKMQTYKNFECIIIDDCSTDTSHKQALQAIDGDNRFFVIKNKVNSGLSATRNIGLLYASGDYVLFLDADDMISPTCIAEHLRTCANTKYKNVAGSYSQHKNISEDQTEPLESKNISQQEIASFYNKLGCPQFVVHACLIRRDIAIGVGGFNEKFLFGAEDFEFFSKIFRHGFIFLPTRTVNAFYRSLKHSMVREFSSQHLSYALKIQCENNSFVSNETFYSIAHCKMHYPSFHYKLEQNYLDRILKFVGMAIYNNQEPIINDLEKYLSNFHNGIPFEISPENVVLQGIRRSSLSSNTSELKEKYHERINTYLSILKNISKNNYKEPINSNAKILYQPCWQRNIDILFFPHKDYHTEIIHLLEPHLQASNIIYCIVDLSAIYRDEGVRAVVKKYQDMPYVSFATSCFGDFAPKSIIVFNDWDIICTKPIVDKANELGIATISIVEGIQDYNDCDTGKKRNAYKSTHYVITPCKFDLKYFDNSNDKIFEGCMPKIPHLAEMAKKFPYNPMGKICINSNFSYGVLAETRNSWIKDAVEACLEVGRDYTITQHPADNGDLSIYNVTSQTMYEAILNCSIFVSRFSTGIIECLAMGRPVIYFNPHGEKIDKFMDPLGAYYIASSKDELKTMIKKTFDDLCSLRKHWPDFLELHAGYRNENTQNSSLRIVNIIKHILENENISDQVVRQQLGANLIAIFNSRLRKKYQHTVSLRQRSLKYLFNLLHKFKNFLSANISC